MDKIRSSGRELAGISVLLVILTFVVFGQTLHFKFVNFDDDENVYANPQVTNGISPHGIEWAFTHTQVGRWTPVATLSRMIDCQLFGLWAGGHHLTNVLLHALTAVLLFFALRELTTLTWRSGFVAAVFALHPLHVESVAWVSARGELLCGLFFMLSLWSYARYARNPKRRFQYAISLACFILGLLSKPMIVTLPFVLLLLDYWPLRRFGAVSPSRLIGEKIPYFLLSAASCAITCFVAAKVEPADHLPLWLRAQNAFVCYGVYLRQTLLPSGLAVYYPNPTHAFSFWEVVASLVLFCLLTIITCGLRNKRPYLPVGWLWFVGMLVPVVGFVQVSNYTRADRYTYLPQIGLVIGLAWALADWAKDRIQRVTALICMGFVILMILLVIACKQTSYWRSSETLWNHNLECTSDKFVARYNLGNALREEGRTAEAIAQYRTALQINPASLDAHTNLSLALLQSGREDEAIVEAQNALKLKPNDAVIENNLAWMLATSRQPSLRNGTRAVQLATQASHAKEGQNPLFLYTLAAAYAEAREFPKAIQTAQSALHLAETRNNTNLVNALRRVIELYNAGQPFEQEP